MMELLLLTDIDGIGRKNDLVVVGDGFALNHLLPKRKALVATPNVRRRYADQIKRRALEKQQETDIRSAALAAIADKIVSIKRKATKTGKLYAAITEDMVATALKEQHNASVTADSLNIQSPIKALGEHKVSVEVGGQTTSFKVLVEAEA